MRMEKKRVEWKVNLYPYNLGEKKGELYPVVALRGTVDLEGVIDAVIAERSELRRETLRSVAHQLMEKAEDLLMEGFAVSTPLGILTPSVTGMWNANRLSSGARAENKAVLNYTMSGGLKKAFANPLLQERKRPDAGPRMYRVIDLATGAQDGSLTPGSLFRVSGQLLLMNGDLPERGLYLCDRDTGREAAFIPANEFPMNSRSEIYARLPEDVPPGQYTLKVLSQCTTNPRAMKAAAAGVWRGTVTVPFPEETNRKGEPVPDNPAQTGCKLEKEK